MRKTALALVFTVLQLSPAAYAENTPPAPPPDVWGESQGNEHQLRGLTNPPIGAPEVAPPPAQQQTRVLNTPICATDGSVDSASCTELERCEGDGILYFRSMSDSAGAGNVCIHPAGPDPGLLAIEEFYRYKPHVPNVVAYPGPTSLVNWPTNLSVATEAIEQPLTLVGQPVTLRVTPIEWTWIHGDDSTQTTKISGTSLNSDDATELGRDIENTRGYVTHKYAQRGDVALTVQVRYQGEYKVGDGQYILISGTITVESAPTALNLKEARAELVDPNTPMD